MGEEAESNDRARSRRRRASKAPGREGADRRNKNLILGAEAWERLAVHAAMTRQSESAVVEALIHANLRRYVVQERGPRQEGISASCDGEISDSAATLPIAETLNPPPSAAGGKRPGKGRGEVA